MFEPLTLSNDTPTPLAKHLTEIDRILIEEGRRFVAENSIEEFDAIDAMWVERMGSKGSEIAETREAATTDPRPYLAYRRAARLGGSESYYHNTYARLLGEQIERRQAECGLARASIELRFIAQQVLDANDPDKKTRCLAPSRI